MIHWCKECQIPIFENKICPICNTHGDQIASTTICNPVFAQERRLMSYILDKNIVDSNVWYLGSAFYLINGKRVKLPFVQFYKARKHLKRNHMSYLKKLNVMPIQFIIIFLLFLSLVVKIRL